MSEAARATTGPRPEPARGALVAYRWVLTAFLLLGVVQFFLAGLGTFGGGFDAHEVLGYVMAGVAVVAFVCALVARVGARDVVLTLLLVLLTGGAQSLLANAGWRGAFWGGLHALDGLAILGIAGFVHGVAVRRARQGRPVSAGRRPARSA